MKKKSVKNIFIVFMLNILFSVIELVGGFLTNSVSIMADAIHDFGDAISILISLVLEKISKKKPNNEYTFGYLRYSIFGALITSTILLVGSVLVGVSSVKRIINPVEVNYDGMLILSIIGIFVNLVATKITHKTNNLNEKMVSLHMLEDVLGWSCVFVGSIIIKITNMYIIDPILSLLVALFILINVIKKYKNILDILLEKKPDKINVLEVRKHILNIKEVRDVHHLHIWSIDGINNYITLHILIDDDIISKDLEGIKKKINDELNGFGINHSTIEFESKKCSNTECVIKENNCNCSHHHH